MNWSNPKLCRLAIELQELDAFPIHSPDQLAAWDTKADALRQKLYSEYEEIYDSLPHEIEHYLTDSDIRTRDSGYADYQRKQLKALLEYKNEN